MADVITRFKLETTQYDSKLRDAAKGLADYARVASVAGNEFDKFTKDQAEAARALGSISTSANNAKDKVRELVNAYNQAANAYNALTKEQQQSDWGRALAESINTLKGRITEAKQELYSMGDSAKNSGGIMDVLAQKFTVNIDALKLFNVGLSAAKAALDVAKDAFFASEANVDEWGRTMASAEALYSGFVTALNSSDFSSFLTQIDGIVQAAREAYDELDKLGTMRTIQAPGFAKQEAENQRLRLMIMTGKFIEAGDGRKSPLGLKNGDILSPEQIRTLERQLQNGMNKIVSLTKNELGQTGKAIDAYYNSLAKQNGMSIQEFRQGTSSWDAYQEKMRGYEQYQKWNDKAAADYYRQGGRNGFMNFDNGNPYLEFKKWGVFRVDKMGTNSYNDLVGLIKQQQQQQQQMYSTLGQTYRTINRAEGVTVKSIMNGVSSGKGGPGGGGGRSGGQTIKTEEQLNNDEIQKLTQEYIKASDERRAAIRAEIKDLQDKNKVIKQLTEEAQGLKFDDGSLPALTKQLQELQKQQSQSADGAEWDDYQKKIDATNDKINILKGNLPKDYQATFTMNVNDEQLQKLRQMIPTDDKTIKVNVEQGRVDLPSVPTEDKTIKVSVTADTSEAMKQVRDLVNGIEGTTVELKVKPAELAVGISGANNTTVAAYVKQLQQDIDGIDFSVAGSFKKAFDINQNIIDATTLGNLLKTSLQRGIDLAAAGIDVESILDKITSGEGIEDADWKGFIEKVNEQLKKQGIKLSIDTQTGSVSTEKDNEQISNFDKGYSTVVNGVNSIVSGIQSMGVEIPEGIQRVLGVLTGISSIMSGITAILALIEIDTKVTATTSAIKSVPIIGEFLAQGGMVPHAANGYYVPGRSYSNDLTPIMANAGELVLNTSSQKTLANDIERAQELIGAIGSLYEYSNTTLSHQQQAGLTTQIKESGGLHVVGELQGEKIALVVDRFGRRTGKGELAFWK